MVNDQNYRKTIFLKLFPDFTVEDLDKVNFITLSVLPATTQSTEICNECQKHIVFRNDLNPNCSPHDSLVELLYNDMTQPNKQDSKSFQGRSHWTPLGT